MIRKTAIIERVHIYGTSRHMLNVRYRGQTLAWAGKHEETGMSIARFAEVTENAYRTDPHRARTRADVQQCEAIARRFGFTHVRFEGEWPIGGRPSGGAL